MAATSSVAPRPRGRFAALQAMRYPSFRIYWFAMLGSVFGQSMQYVIVAWLVLELTNSPLLIGMVGLAQAIPNLGLSLVGGALADRVDRTRMLTATQLAAASLFLALGTLILTGLIDVWHVFVFAFVLGCVRAFDSPSRQAILPLLLPMELVGDGVALINVVWQLPRLVGPAIAGIMIAEVGIGWTFYLAGSGTLSAAILFAIMRVPRVETVSKESFLRTIVDGVRFICREEIYWSLIGLTFFNSVFGMSYTFLMPVFARDILHVGSQGYGFLQTGAAVGGILGIGVAALLNRPGHRGLYSILGAAIYGFLLIGFASSGWYPTSMAIMFLLGGVNQAYMTISNTVLLMQAPDEYRGRVMGVYGLSYSLISIGGTFAGGVAQATSAPMAVAIGGALVALSAVAIAVVAPSVRSLK